MGERTDDGRRSNQGCALGMMWNVCTYRNLRCENVWWKECKENGAKGLAIKVSGEESCERQMSAESGKRFVRWKEERNEPGAKGEAFYTGSGREAREALADSWVKGCGRWFGVLVGRPRQVPTWQRGSGEGWEFWYTQDARATLGRLRHRNDERTEQYQENLGETHQKCLVC